jgi:hypothetical protein
MNIVIPQNFKEGQQFLTYLSKLNDAEFTKLAQLYQTQGISLFRSQEKFDSASLVSKNETINISGKSIRFWNRGGQLHRENSPAVEWDDGEKEYWVNGKRHRDDGPSSIDINGNTEWFFEGNNLNAIKERFYRHLKFNLDLAASNFDVVFEKFGVNFTIDYDFIKSLIEFLWQNGYQFDEYLPGSFQVDKFEKSRCEEFLEIIEKDSYTERKILNALKIFYLSTTVQNKIIPLIDSNEHEDNMEILKNMNLIQSKNPSIEDIFKNWQSYDELQESFSLKAFWS